MGNNLIEVGLERPEARGWIVVGRAEEDDAEEKFRRSNNVGAGLRTLALCCCAISALYLLNNTLEGCMVLLSF